MRSSPSTVTRTPVVFRISHDHARAQRCAKYPLESKTLDTIEAGPSTIVYTVIAGMRKKTVRHQWYGGIRNAAHCRLAGANADGWLLPAPCAFDAPVPAGALHREAGSVCRVAQRLPRIRIDRFLFQVRWYELIEYRRHAVALRSIARHRDDDSRASHVRQRVRVPEQLSGVAGSR